jgi:maltose O-acetyltransferase
MKMHIKMTLKKKSIHMIKNLIRKVLLHLRGEVSTHRLKQLGLKVGHNFNRRPGCIIDYSHAWLISIGNNVTLAPRVHILAHDASTQHALGYTKISKVNIGDNVFIGANAIVLPGTTIGSNVIIGAGSLVKGLIPPNSIVAGNPAKVIMSYEDFIERNKKEILDGPCYDSTWTDEGGITNKMKDQMRKEIKNKHGFVR